MALVTYECCFCGNQINEKSKFDPCYVSIVSNLDKDESQQLEQMFFCHYECFRGRLIPGVREYLNFEDQK